MMSKVSAVSTTHCRCVAAALKSDHPGSFRRSALRPRAYCYSLDADLEVDHALLGHTKGGKGAAELLNDTRETLVDDVCDRILAMLLFDTSGQMFGAVKTTNLQSQLRACRPRTSSSKPLAIRSVLRRVREAHSICRDVPPGLEVFFNKLLNRSEDAHQSILAV